MPHAGFTWKGRGEVLVSELLELDSVVKVFAIGFYKKTRIVAVDRVSMSVRSKEILGLLGESGSGKSTIAKLVLKILKPTRGAIKYRGRDIWTINTLEYYRRVQGVFQDPYATFNPRRKVLDLLIDVLNNYYAREGVEWSKILKETLSMVGMDLKEVEGKYPHEFSGGQLQRLSIARALLVKPEVIVADEPVSMVDASTRIDILNIFIDLRDYENTSSVIIGHDLSLTYYVSDRVVVLYRGQVVEEGPVDILQDPAHPYTKMLRESVPRIESRWTSEMKYSYEAGEHVRQGCVFAHRCPFKLDTCIKQEPPTITLGRSKVKCWLYTPK